MAEKYESSTVVDTEFDVIDELTRVLDEVDNGLSNQEDLLEKTTYMRFLINELADSLSGNYEPLRRRRFITKKSE
jgi:hypothetical protein